MVLKRRSTVTPKRAVRASVITTAAPDTPNSRKRAGESLAVRTKKIKVEFQELFDQFKKAHDEEISSIVLSMGSGDAGQLGLGDEFMERKRPYPIDGLSDIVAIRAGGMHNICLSKNGKVFTFGCNDDFALGRKIIEDEESMVPGEVVLPPNCQVIDITAGDSHSAVLTAEGKVYIWGSFRDNNGVIGLIKPYERVPEPVELIIDQKVVKIASGENHFVMLTNMGDILSFGCAEQGQLGRVREVYLVRGGKSGMEMLLTPAPMRVKQHLRFTDIWAGSNCTVARSIEGDLYGCGLNNFTQLGISDELSVLLMTKMTKFNNLNQSWKSFAFGQHHTMGMTESKRVFVIGRGDYGSLGLGDNVNREEVIEVPIVGVIDNIASCSHVSFALLNDGTALSWGCGNTYQLGHGDDEDVNEPTKVIGKLVADMKLVEISVGGQHVLFRAVKKVEKTPTVLAVTSAVVMDEKSEEVEGICETKDSAAFAEEVKERETLVEEVKEIHTIVEEVKEIQTTFEEVKESESRAEELKDEMEIVKEDCASGDIKEITGDRNNNNCDGTMMDSVASVTEEENKTVAAEAMEH